MTSSVSVSIVVPCFNEAAIIRKSAETLLTALSALSPEFEIIFCNDGSTDDTAALLDELQTQDKRIKAVGYTVNRGAGFAFRTAVAAARGDIVVHSDADLAIAPGEVVTQCLSLLRDSDIAVASRYAGVRADYPLRRRVPSMVYRALCKVLFGLSLSDFTSGSFGFRRSILETIAPLEADGFEIYVELFSKAQRAGLRIVEFPARFVHDTSSGEVSVLASAPRQLANTIKVWARQR